MAKCSKCGSNVGCSCQLRSGLCSSCFSAANPQIANVQRPQPQTPLHNPQRNRVHVNPNRYNPPVVNKAYWTK